MAGIDGEFPGVTATGWSLGCLNGQAFVSGEALRFDPAGRGNEVMG